VDKNKTVGHPFPPSMGPQYDFNWLGVSSLHMTKTTFVIVMTHNIHQTLHALNWRGMDCIKSGRGSM
jgi:hypothetical protein